MYKLNGFGEIMGRSCWQYPKFNACTALDPFEKGAIYFQKLLNLNQIFVVEASLV